jgi:hypothetical protein
MCLVPKERNRVSLQQSASGISTIRSSDLKLITELLFDMITREQREYILTCTENILEPIGFKFEDGQPPSFVRSKEGVISRVQFYFGTKTRFAGFSKMQISHRVVEKVILDVGFPDIDLTDYRKGLQILPTVVDKESVLDFDAEMNGIKSEEDLKLWGNALTAYLNNEGGRFLSQYSSLSNVLTKMNELQTDEGRNWTEILAGGPEFLFRGLIISKLCNDVDYLNKAKYIDELFLSKIPETWRPYYDDLKKRLEMKA